MKTVLILLFLVLGGTEIYSQNEVVFNIPKNCNRIRGKSWRCCGTVIVQSNGRISSHITTSSNRWQGFTGALKITFYDRKNRAIYEIMTPSYGVNGKSSRNDKWRSSVPKWVIQHSRKARSEGVHNSSNRTGKLILSAGMQYVKQQTANSGFQF